MSERGREGTGVVVRLHVHVLVVEGFDSVGFTAKQGIFDAQQREMERRGLPFTMADPQVFHYSVDYDPVEPSSSTLYVVSTGSLPWVCTDAPGRALALADRLAEAGKDDVSIVCMPLVRTDETPFERSRIERRLRG